MTPSAGADMSRCCLMETKYINGTQNGEKSLLTLIESWFSYVNSHHIRDCERWILPYPCWKLPLCIFIFILWVHSLCTCCQAITHVYLYRFNCPLNCLFNHFVSAFLTLIVFYNLQWSELLFTCLSGASTTWVYMQTYCNWLGKIEALSLVSLKSPFRITGDVTVKSTKSERVVHWLSFFSWPG